MCLISLPDIVCFVHMWCALLAYYIAISCSLQPALALSSTQNIKQGAADCLFLLSSTMTFPAVVISNETGILCILSGLTGTGWTDVGDARKYRNEFMLFHESCAAHLDKPASIYGIHSLR